MPEARLKAIIKAYGFNATPLDIADHVVIFVDPVLPRYRIDWRSKWGLDTLKSEYYDHTTDVMNNHDLSSWRKFNRKHQVDVLLAEEFPIPG